MRLYLLSGFVVFFLVCSSRAEEIDVKWNIIPLEGSTNTKAFSAKTLLPNGAKAKVKVVGLKKDCYIYFMDPYPLTGLPKTHPLNNIGDRVNCLIDKEGKLTLVSPLANAVEIDGKRLSFSNGLIVEVVVED